MSIFKHIEPKHILVYGFLVGVPTLAAIEIKIYWFAVLWDFTVFLSFIATLKNKEKHLTREQKEEIIGRLR